jgi:YesN/AraC family two-component response regulator
MKLFVKHMVSNRCKRVVENVLNTLAIPFHEVGLGEVELVGFINQYQRNQLRLTLAETGLELMDNKKDILVQRIKNALIEMIHYASDLPKTKISCYLSKSLDYDYTYLSNLFSEMEGTTIGQFILLHKIERVKEQITYNELNLTQIADMLNYSSVAHLSTQFKKITGFTPSSYKSLKQPNRMVLESIC